MEWNEALRWLIGYGILLVPLVMLVVIGAFILLLPCGFLAGLILKRTEREEAATDQGPTIRHAH